MELRSQELSILLFLSQERSCGAEASGQGIDPSTKPNLFLASFTKKRLRNQRNLRAFTRMKVKRTSTSRMIRILNSLRDCNLLPEENKETEKKRDEQPSGSRLQSVRDRMEIHEESVENCIAEKMIQDLIQRDHTKSNYY